MISDVANMDCMAYMAQFPDKFFDLAVVDPPYGIKVTKMSLGNGKNKVFRGQSNWDDAAPGDDYFKELMRVSKIKLSGEQITLSAESQKIHHAGWYGIKEPVITILPTAN